MKKFVSMGLMSAAVMGFAALPAVNAAPHGPEGLRWQEEKPVVFNHSTHTANTARRATTPGRRRAIQPALGRLPRVMDKMDKSGNSYYLARHNNKPAHPPVCLPAVRLAATRTEEEADQLQGFRLPSE
jgi:hypothetical protein